MNYVVTLEGLEHRGRLECSIDGCFVPAYAKGWCEKHYSRARRHGDPTVVLQRGRPSEAFGTLRERFDAKVARDANEWGCWEWTGAHHELGYGRINDRSTGELRQLRAHVLAWEWENGPVPEGKELDHFLYPMACIGPACCNPGHVRPVTHAENMARSVHAISPTCKRGHPRTNETIYERPDGRRDCRACRREREGSRP